LQDLRSGILRPVHFQAFRRNPWDVPPFPLPDLKALFSSGASIERVHESFVLQPGIDFLPKACGPASLARGVREVPDKV